MTNRFYQDNAIIDLKASIVKGHKNIMLFACTGSGKSIIIKTIFEMALAKNPNAKLLYVVHRSILVKQMQETLKDMNVVVKTLQTAGKDSDTYYDLVLSDEAHYGKDSKLANNINCKFNISLSATPITSDGYALDYDEIIDVVQLCDLIDLGFASPVKVLSTSKVDTSTLKSQNGDFKNSEAFELMNKSSIKKDIVEVYKQHAQHLKTIIYAVNIQHAESLKQEFLNNGIKCDVVHSKKNDSEQIINDFKNGKINLLINIDILTTGYDDGKVYCLILAAPTKSYIKAIQIYGRATRLDLDNPNKEALIIDVAEVIKNTCHPLQRLDLTRKKTDKNQVLCKKCKCKMKLINRETKTINEYEYSVISDYKCECGNLETIENLKLFNNSICENCNNIFESKDGIQMTKNEKNVLFEMKCNFCGHKRKFRELLLTDDELKEIKLEESIKNGSSWEDVIILLKHYCKQDGYHHRYAIRLMDTIKARGYTPDLSIKNIQLLRKQGKKISYLMYVKE